MPPPPQRRPTSVFQLPPGQVPLERALSKLGLATRTQARQWIEAGRVAVDGKVQTNPQLGVVPERVQVVIDGALAEPMAETKVLALHKPRGVLTTRVDPQGRKTVYDLLTDVPDHLIPVGRLDQATSGLLLLTNHTRLHDRLLDPRLGLERVYVVVVEGRVDAEQLPMLLAGVTDQGEQLRADAAELRKSSGRESTLVLTLREGRNREVRRLCAALGHPVQKLKRVRYGPVELGDLPVGQWRWIDAAPLLLVAGLAK